MYADKIALGFAVVNLFACGHPAGGGDASAAPSSTTAPAKGGTKACPDGYPYCVTLPAGYSLGKPNNRATFGSCDVLDGDKKYIASLYWNPGDTYDGAILGDKSFMDAGADAKTETFLDGKGVYHEWKSKDADRKGTEYEMQAYVKGTPMWHCGGHQDKASTSKVIETICKSMVAK